MSASIAPRIDTISIGFSPQHPKFQRQQRRPENSAAKPTPDQARAEDHQAQDAQDRESLPPETLFEAALLSDNRPLSPYEIARKLSRQWAPPDSAFPLTDKTI